MKNASGKRTAAKYLGLVLSTVGLSGAFISFFVTTRYLRFAPLIPDPDAGITHAVKIRGEVIYLSWTHYLIQMGLLPASFVVTMLGGYFFIVSSKKL